MFGMHRFKSCTGDYAFRLPGYHKFRFTPKKYENTIEWVQNKHEKFSTRFQKATASQDKQDILENADEHILHTIDEQIFPFWYGTPYYFFGESQVPGKGKTSCGHFVTTVLEDAGFVLNRRQLAQYPSELMIKHLVAPDKVKRFSNLNIEQFITEVQRLGNGLYVTGLDTHSGFTLNRKGDVYFIHASGRHPNCVLKEAAVESKVLQASKYRVLGKISGDFELVEKWITRDSLILPKQN